MTGRRRRSGGWAQSASDVSGKVSTLGDRLDKLGSRVATARVGLEGNKDAQAQLDQLDVKLLALGRKTANPNISVEGVARAQADISKIDLALDHLNDKSAKPSLLSRLFGGGGSSGGGRGIGGLLSGAGSAVQPVAIGAAVAGAAALAPSTIPVALGGILGALGPLLAFPAMIKKDFGGVLSAFRQVMAPLRPLFQSVFGGLAAFTKSIGPQLRDLFKASIPFLKMFVAFLEQSGKILLPVFTAALKQMTPFLPLMSQGLLSIVQGLAGMIKAMGPGGMKASAEVFVGLCKAMEGILIATGWSASLLAKTIMTTAHVIRTEWPKVAAMFDDFRHRTAVVFDGVRHDIAHVWDMIYQNSVGMVIRLGHNVLTQFNSLQHGIAAAWNTIWNNTVARVRSGVNDVVTWFRGLPGRVLAALVGLGHQLYAFGHAALGEMWSGFKAIGSSILSWIGNFVGNIVGDVKKLLHIGSPSGVFFDIGKNMMLGLEGGIKANAHRAASAASAAVGGTKYKGKFGAGVQQWAPDVLRALGMLGLSPMLLGNVLFQMQTESGGNPNAINLTDSNAAAGDPSRGLMQTIGTTFAAYAGPFRGRSIYDPMANIYAALNYAMHRYGRSLMSGGMGIGSGHGYDTGGWLPPGVSVAVNRTGVRRARHVPRAGDGADGCSPAH